MAARLSCCLIGLLLCVPLDAQAAPFRSPPQVQAEGELVKIRFAPGEATDVEVAVLDAQRRVVRHLAAGVLGGDRQPPPPLKPGLEQELTWDRKDDRGRAAAGGPFTLRVRLGMQVAFGRMIGGSPYTGVVESMPYRAPVNGLAVDGQGNLLVKMMSSVGSHGNSGLWPWHVRRFDRDGNYLETLLPYPPSTDPARASGFRLLDTPAGAFTPALENSLYPVFYSFGNELGSRLVDGSLVFVRSESREINLFKLDGSNQVRNIKMWPESAKLNCPRWLDIQVAFSPDGRTAYYSNVAGVPYDGKQPADIDPKWPQGRIYRHRIDVEGSTPEPLFDLALPDWNQTQHWLPSAWDKKSAAAGIDTDQDGNVLVCDLVNGQIVEISPAGEKLSATPVPWPDKVMVSRKTGALYVISRKVSRGFLPPATLRKIQGRGDRAKVVAELALAGTVGGAYTLDESGTTPVLWLAGNDKGQSRLWRVEDQGAELAVAGKSFLNRDADAVEFVGYMDVDADEDLVYVTRSGGDVWRFKGEDGSGGRLPIKAVDLSIGPEGMIYTWGTSGSYQGPVARFTRDLEPAPLGDTGKHTFGFLYGRAGRGASVCGLDVDVRGRVFATYGSNVCHVRAYDEQGQLVPYGRTITTKDRRGKVVEVPAAIDGVSGYGGSIRVDAAGNLYLLQFGVPEDYQLPPGYEKDEAYRATVGTILKFGPEGGKSAKPLGSGGQRSNPLAFEGALAMYPGCGPISRWRCAGSCACTKPRFDVDAYGRLVIPSGVTYQVSLRDNAGNEILHFGRYGNFDCQGPNSRRPSPAIPLGWPIVAGASDRYLYVGDCLNHRIVRVDKSWQTETTVAIK